MVVDPEGGPGARPLALRPHLLVPGLLRRGRHQKASVTQDLLSQVARKPVRVVQGEEEPSVNRPRLLLGAALSAHPLFDAAQAVVQRLREPLLLLADDLLDPRLVGHQLRIGLTHDLSNPGNRPPQERLGETEHSPVTHGPPHDAAEHVAAPLVGRDHAIADQEGRASVRGPR